MLVVPEKYRVCVLQTGRSPEQLRATHGDYDDMCKSLIGRAPEQADTFAVLDGKFPQTFNYDLFLITGSRHGVYEDHEWISPLEEYLRGAWEAGKKILGICFGHQILAQALGGTVAKSDKGFGVGVMEYECRLGSQTHTVALHAWHQDQVVSKPENAEVFMSSEFCPIAGLRYGTQALSFQPHPEFSHAYMRELVGVRTGVLPASLVEIALNSLSEPTDTALVQELISDLVDVEVVT